MSSPTPALVLTAGLATRLRPLSLVRAKAALPVANEPLIQRILRWLGANGIDDLVLNLHHRPDTLTRIDGGPGKTASAVRRVGMGVVGRLSPIRNRLMNEARGTSGDLPLLLRGLPI